MDNLNIRLRVHIRGGKIYDFTKLVNSITWSGDYRSPSRTLEVIYLNPVMDSNIPTKDVLINSTCCFYVDEVELFRGNCVDIEKNSSNNTTTMNFKDIGNMLARDKKCYNFVGVKGDDVVKKIFKENMPPIYAEHIEPNTSLITQAYINKTGYEIIMDVYTKHSKEKNGKYKYMVVANLDKINVVKKGDKFINIEFSESKNIIDTQYKQDINEFVNRVLVVDENGNKVSEKINNDLRKIYSRISTEILQQRENEKVSTDEINKAFHGVDNTCTLKGIGNIYTRTGGKVNVRDTHTGLVGVFYIDKDTHTWSGGNYEIELELNFDNLMDEHDVKDDTNKDNKSSNSNGMGVDWGHGVSVDSMNKALENTTLAGWGETFIKWGNAYKVNPMLVAIIMKIESKPKLNSGLALQGNNFGGIRPIKGYPIIAFGNQKYTKFPSKEVGVEENFRLLGVRYLHDWKKNSISSIILTYAPGSDGNNPTQYIANIKALYKQNTGTTWNEKLLGTGVASKEEARKNLATNLSSGGKLTTKQEIIVKSAISKLGSRYTWGAIGPNSFDCSGFCYWCHKQAGIKIGQHSAEQLKSGRAVNSNELQVADIIITRSKSSESGRHVKLYIGDGYCIEAASPKQGVIKSKLNYGDGLITIRRCWE